MKENLAEYIYRSLLEQINKMKRYLPEIFEDDVVLKIAEYVTEMLESETGFSEILVLVKEDENLGILIPDNTEMLVERLEGYIDYGVRVAIGYVMKITGRLSELRKYLRELMQVAYKIIAVIGAGASFEAGLPLSRHLEPILKQILGEKVLEQIKQQVKQTEKDPLKECFKIISNNKEKDREFKERFRELIENGLKSGDIKITRAQEIIVEEFINGKIVEIICLNWDNLLEICYRNKKGEEPCKINKHNKTSKIKEDGFAHCIWKFHGDVEDEDLKYKWIYPGIEGRVFQTFIDYYNNKIKESKTTFIVLVLGYSEADEEIKKNVIEFLEKNHTIYRIGMSLDLLKKYDNYIFAPLEWIVPFIFGKSS